MVLGVSPAVNYGIKEVSREPKTGIGYKESYPKSVWTMKSLTVS